MIGGQYTYGQLGVGKNHIGGTQMKVLHISDTHIDITATKLGKLKIIDGDNDVYKKRLNLIEYIINIGINEKVNYIIFSGDIFNKSRPYPQEYFDFANILRKIPKNIIVHLISGNHDEVTQRGCALQPLTDIHQNVFCSIQPDYGLFICAPWNTKLDWIKQTREKFDYQPILVFHCGVWSNNQHWVELDGESGNVDLQSLQALDCSAIMLGHHHNQISLDQNIWYAGSPEVFYFGEENDNKGFLIWDIEKNKAQVKQYSTKELLPTWKTFTPIEFLEFENEFDGYIRVKGETDEKTRLNIIKKLNNFKCLDYKLDLQNVVKRNRVFRLEGKNDNEILKNYLKSKDIKNIKEILDLDQHEFKF